MDEEIAKSFTPKELKALMKTKWSLEGFANSARDHVGRVIDNTRLSEVLDTSILLGCGYFGAKAGGLGQPNSDTEAVAAGALAGMIGYKLATTFGGTPPASQFAGLAILSTIGAINTNVPTLVQSWIDGEVEKLQKEICRLRALVGLPC